MPGAGQASDTNTFGRSCVRGGKQATIFSIRLRWHKIDLFSGLEEERRTPRATSRPLDHGPNIFEAVIYIHRPCPTRTGLAVGCFYYVDIEGLSSRELFVISVLAIFNVKAQVPPRTAA